MNLKDKLESSIMKASDINSEFDAELDKLKLIAHPQKTITKEMVENRGKKFADLIKLPLKDNLPQDEIA